MLVRIAIPLFIIALGFLVQTYLVQSKPEAETVAQESLGPLVEVMTAEFSEQALRVEVEGTVVPAQQVTIQTEVSGRIQSRSKHLVPGGRFQKGEELLKISASEYLLRAAQSASEVEQARQQLALEKSRGEIAKEEWQLIGDKNASKAGRDAALRVPYEKEAQARLQAAQQQIKLARLNLERTEIAAPFNGFVQAGQVEVGQLVAPGTPLATLVGSDKFWVQVSIPVESLSSIMVPGLNAAQGSIASIWQAIGDEKIVRKGAVLRLLGDLDPVGQQARILVEIEDPLGLEKPESERGVPLLLGSFVHVKIEARKLTKVIEIPRKAIHAGRYVHLFTEGGLLEIKSVTIAWKTPETYLISEGLSPGDQVILSRLGNSVQGMQLRKIDYEKPGKTSELDTMLMPGEAGADGGQQ